MPVEDEFVEVGGLLAGGQAMESQVIEDEQVGREERPEGGSVELSTLAWVMALKKSAAWTKRTVCPARMAA